MRPKNRKQAEGKTTLLGVGWLFPHCRWIDWEQKSPEDLRALRVNGKLRRLPMATVTTAGTTIVAAPTTPIVAAIVARAVGTFIPRRAVIPWRRTVVHGWRVVAHRRRAVNDRRRAVNDGRRTISDGRCIPHGSTERKANRNTRLRRGGEPNHCDHGNQTEDRFCSHAGFDGGFNGVFSRQKSRDVFRCEAVREKGSENE